MEFRPITPYTVDGAGRFLYFCNPDKNKECRKSECFRTGGECFLTAKQQYAYYDDERGKSNGKG